MASNGLTVPDVKHALDVAREALELDAEESRLRGRTAASPDVASLGMLAAGILIANAIKEERNDAAEETTPPTARRPQPAKVRARA